MNWRWLSGHRMIGILLLAGIVGMAGCIGDPYLKRNVKGPIISDDLTQGSSKAAVEGGTFTKSGWQPGETGSLTYELPPMPQGMISFDVTGLSRTAPDALLLTMFEKPYMEYVDPYIAKNPYLITVTTKNFQGSPDAPFDFLWTIKNFPVGTAEDDRCVDGIPEGVLGYQKSLATTSLPIFPDQKYNIQLEWFTGKARMMVNGQVVAEHVYTPLLFAADNLRLVIGKSPLSDSLNSNSITISNVWISYPTIYHGGMKK